MTCEEAIEILQEERDYAQFLTYVKEAIKIATTALEKQIPKKPLLQDVYDKNNKLLDYLYNCPICHMFICYATELGIEERFAYCPNCGQAIDWEVEDKLKENKHE